MNSIKLETQGYPFEQDTLQFMQDAYREAIGGAAMAGADYNAGRTQIVTGCNVTISDAGGGNKTVTWSEGFLLFKGEVLFVPSGSATGPTADTVYWVPVVTSDPARDPALFEAVPNTGSTVPKNVHDIRRGGISFTQGPAGNDQGVDVASVRRVGEAEAWRYVGTAAQPAFATGWGNDSARTAAGYSGVAFRRLPNGKVELRGHAIRSSGSGLSVFTLPEGYRPAFIHESYVAFEGTAGFGQAFIINTAGVVSVNPEWQSGSNLVFDGFTFSLD